MIEWLIGSTQSTRVEDEGADDGATCLDDAPETPAPLFAIRAFKQALFGTPQAPDAQLKIQDRGPRSSHGKHLAAKSSPYRTDVDPQASVNALSGTADHKIERPQARLSHSMDYLVSPTKGILLTPGTGAIRRKTVSFGKSTNKTEKCSRGLLDHPSHKDSTMIDQEETNTKTAPPKRHSTLTRTLIEMSSKSSDPQDIVSVKTDHVQSQHDSSMDNRVSTESGFGEQTSKDQTVDLNQPRSRSGQHWKLEYEQYYRRSNNEIRKVIQYGQNVKSYAVKKDREASHLNERLKRELAKLARMEAKMTRLAQRQTSLQQPEQETESDHMRLVGELAQQTALTARYRSESERYRVALEQHPSQPTTVAKGIGSHRDRLEIDDDDLQTYEAPDVAMLQTQIRSLEIAGEHARERSEALDAENMQLKRSLSRVKEEMMSYETRRHAREERLRKREDRLKKAREASEFQNARLEKEFQELLHAQKAKLTSCPRCLSRLQTFQEVNDPIRAAKGIDAVKYTPPQDAQAENQPRQPSVSPSKRRLRQKSTLDIWTASSPRADEDDARQSPPPHPSGTQHPPLGNVDREKRDRTLQPIDTNQISSKEQPMAASQVKTTDIPEFNEIPRSEKQTTSKIAPARNATSRQTSLRSSYHAGSRTNTMGSGRTSSLSVERTAAAKARLAQRKRENRKEGM